MARYRGPLVQVTAVFAGAMLYIWWIRFHWPGFRVVLLAFVVGTHVWFRESPRALGFTTAGFTAALRAMAIYVAIVAVALILTGVLLGSLREIPPATAARDVALYCLWGLFQQYILNGYFVNRICAADDFHEPHRAALYAAVLFALAHTPNAFLMIAALVGGYAAARVYLRFHNLLVLGLAHGVLGFLIVRTLPDSLTHHLYVGPRYWLH